MKAQLCHPMVQFLKWPLLSALLWRLGLRRELHLHPSRARFVSHILCACRMTRQGGWQSSLLAVCCLKAALCLFACDRNQLGGMLAAKPASVCTKHNAVKLHIKKNQTPAIKMLVCAILLSLNKLHKCKIFADSLCDQRFFFFFYPTLRPDRATYCPWCPGVPSHPVTDNRTVYMPLLSHFQVDSTPKFLNLSIWLSADLQKREGGHPRSFLPT